MTLFGAGRHRKSIPALAAALLVLALLNLAVLDFAGPAAARPPAAAPMSRRCGWRPSMGVAAKLARGDGPVTSCPSTTLCWAIAGGELLRSDTGGATWTPQTRTLPADVDIIDALDCPSVAVCFVTGRLSDFTTVVVALRTSGVTPSSVPGVGRLYAISCPTATRCLATDGTTVANTTDGGAIWSPLTTALPSVGLGALTCAPGSSRCWAMGYYGGATRIHRTANFGASWSAQAAPVTVSSLFAVDCPSTTVCYAAGYSVGSPAVAATSDGGATWSRQTLPSASGALRSISCPTINTCMTFGNQFSWPIAFGTTDAGTTWTAQSLPTAYVGHAAVSCPTTTVCAAVGRDGAAFNTTTAGLTWNPVPVPGALGVVSELSCPTQLRCVGMTREAVTRPVAVTSADGGASWTRHPLPPNTGHVTSLDCTSATSCHAWAVVNVSSTRTDAQALRTTDGGLSWQLHQGVDTRFLGPAVLSCVDSSVCVAVTSGRNGVPVVVSTVDGGLTWHSRGIPSGAQGLDGIACTSVTACVLIGRTGKPHQPSVAWTTNDFAKSYEGRTLPPALNGYFGLDCVGLTCVAVGNDTDWSGRLATSFDGGATWLPRRLPAAATRLQSVSCGRATVCVVGGSDGSQDGTGALLLGTTDRGRTWTTIDIPPSGSSWPSAVACTPYQFACLASDYGPYGYARILAGEA